MASIYRFKYEKDGKVYASKDMLPSEDDVLLIDRDVLEGRKESAKPDDKPSGDSKTKIDYELLPEFYVEYSADGPVDSTSGMYALHKLFQLINEDDEVGELTNCLLFRWRLPLSNEDKGTLVDVVADMEPTSENSAQVIYWPVDKVGDPSAEHHLSWSREVDAETGDARIVFGAIDL